MGPPTIIFFVAGPSRQVCRHVFRDSKPSPSKVLEFYTEGWSLPTGYPGPVRHVWGLLGLVGLGRLSLPIGPKSLRDHIKAKPALLYQRNTPVKRNPNAAVQDRPHEFLPSPEAEIPVLALRHKMCMGSQVTAMGQQHP